MPSSPPIPAAAAAAASSAPQFLYSNLAFSGSSSGSDSLPGQSPTSEGESLVTSCARSKVECQDSSATLNVEWFSKEEAAWPLLAYCHGVCESAETWTVQNLARMCRKNQWRLAVLELEGHGLSSGTRSLCSSFPRVVSHVGLFCHHVATLAPKPKDDGPIPLVLAGSSMGGVAALYAAAAMAKSLSINDNGSDAALAGFAGCALICPAVGVAPEVVPPPPIVMALSALAWVAPSVGLMTPVEDPSIYACPHTSTRNFVGQWPLATSKMLLDVTSKTVQQDLAAYEQAKAKATDGSQHRSTPLDGMAMIPSMLVLAGEKDHVVPMTSIEDVIQKIDLPQDRKILCTIKKGDHYLLVKGKPMEEGISQLAAWLEGRFAREN
eukprot:CAMPEP_0198128680 /NCGR_PEP_ID=MMETSP1442-20131203/49904_1 /TAXON_ID= /ORGANISM="Craspedostauros australis, Strain CCMP3328" /LENGTH=379 /DNA_ID=CAMNT_0043788887 /DNA_START=71 /DNA_END=1210 /DNA_ORIENTATION=+